LIGAKLGDHDCRTQARSRDEVRISPDGGQAHPSRGQRMDEDAWPGVKTGAVRRKRPAGFAASYPNAPFGLLTASIFRRLGVMIKY